MKKLIAAALGLLLAACAAIDPQADAVARAAGAGDRMPSGRVIGTRSATVAPSAAAATAHPLATQTALDVMKRGGNAVDAAIAANAMLGLVEPTGNGIGGDLYAIVWDPKTQKLYGYNGSGRSARGASLADMQGAADKFMGGDEIPPFGAAPVTVPGTVDGWFALNQKFGRMRMAETLAPAIKYAREGAPIPEVIAFYWSRSPDRFAKAKASGMLEEFENARKTYFDPAPVEGSLFRNPDLANTLERIGKNGREEFYKGDTARTIDAYFTRIGGKLRYADFALHTGEWMTPVCAEYRSEVKVCELGPNTQGVAALQMLQMLERFDLKAMGFASADALHVQVEAKRLAFADRAAGYADPAFAKLDPEAFVAPGYNAARGAAIDLTRAMAPPRPGQAATEVKLRDGDTTYLTVADKDGMMVSLIQSNYRGMGSGLVADGLGFMFQDRGQLFSLDPAHPNVFAPGKRPFHTIIPAFAFRKDLPDCQVRATAIDLACPYQPWLSFGLMGGGMQPQGHVQIILNLIDYDMGLQEAGDAARWEHVGGCEPTDALSGDDCDADMGVIELESGIPEATRRALEAKGHKVKCCAANGGGYQAIMRDFRSGAWIAATEMRKDGSADGY
jgi:gamma-glutamyltranspeptidase / glutathione hydrolase